jgi:hypothetical protein
MASLRSSIRQANQINATLLAINAAPADSPKHSPEDLPEQGADRLHGLLYDDGITSQK